MIAGISTLVAMLSVFFILGISLSLFDEPVQPDLTDDFFDLSPLEEMVNTEISATAATSTSEQANFQEKINLQSAPDQPAMRPSVAPVQASDEQIEKIEELEKQPEEPVKPVETAKVEPDTTSLDTAMIAAIEKILNTEKTTASTLSKEELAAKKREFFQKNYKNIRNFLKVYPYALRTKAIVNELNAKLAKLTSESQKKALIKETEKTLFATYEKAVRTMSITQGKILLKFIARETNKTGFDIIKDYRGAISANLWYGVGKIFGTDLKTEYHKEKEDSIYETILKKYNEGDFK